MNKTLPSYLGLLLQSHVPSDISFIIGKYLIPYKYFVLGFYDGELIFHNHRQMEITNIFQAYCIEDVIRYILYDYSDVKNILISDAGDINLPLLRNKLKSNLSKQEWKKYRENSEKYLNDHPQLQTTITKWAQEIYGENPRLFLSDLKEIQLNEQINCMLLMELTPLLSCIHKYIVCDRQCINIYNGQTEDFNIKHFYLYGT
jgi:hypothetical protein